MASNNSRRTTLRYLGFLKQPDSDHPHPDDASDLHEHDVVWSFYPSPDNSSPTTTPTKTNYPHSKSTSPSPPSLRRFSAIQSGLSAALDEGDRHVIRSKVIHVAASRRDINNNNNNRNGNSNNGPNFRQSAPVNIPVWPKAFTYKDWDEEAEDEEEVDEEEEMVPPHVIVARSHVTFSVFEGVGRTLKGRDLRRVRNAVLQKTGFID